MDERMVETPLSWKQRGFCLDENLVINRRKKSGKGCFVGLRWAVIDYGQRRWIEENCWVGLGDEFWAWAYS